MKLHRRVVWQRWGGALMRLVLLVLAVILGVAVIYAARAQRYDLGDLQRMPQRTEVRDRDGELIGTLGGENRIVVSIERIDPKLVRAILAREDARFREHPGIDGLGLLRATLRNAREGRLVQGASTLTMQLARNTWELGDDSLWGEIDRKLMEAVLALRIETGVSKEKIFEVYANRIYLGKSNYGVEAACRDYFNKSARELSWSEAAAIAGLIRAPSTLNPRIAPEANAAERRQVFARLAELGWIEPAVAARYRDEALALRESRREARKTRSAWLLEQVRRELDALFKPDELAKVAEVRTTFDLDLQRRSERQLREHLAAIEASEDFRSTHPGGVELQGAIAVVGTEQGDLRALVGGRDFSRSSFQRAVQMRRQLGSTIKPLVYAAAFEAGLDPSEPVSDAPLSEDADYQGSWDPENADQRNLGRITARDGLVLSRNTVTVRVARHAGRERLDELIAELGLDPQPGSESAWLGAGEGSPLQLASAYTVFPAGGEYRPPWSLLEVRDRSGRVLFAADEGLRRVLAPEVAGAIDECLVEATRRGTARRLAELDFPWQAGGKTGTTNDFLDAWFVGYARDRCACVWIGCDKAEPIHPGAFGSTLALPLWAEVMRPLD